MVITEIREKSDMRRFFVWLCIVWIVYVTLSLLAPSAEAVSRYGISLAQAQLLRITIVLPLFFIWVTALLGLVRFRRYTALVRNSAEADGFGKITKGLWMLLLVIVIPNFITITATYFPDSTEVQRYAIILRNYVSVGLYLVGFIYLWSASKSLLGTIQTVDWGDKYRTYVLAGIGVLSIVYAWLIFKNPFRSISSDPLVRPTYGLPDILIVLTIVIPYVLTWIFGGMAILNFLSYSKRVSGIIYRKTFSIVAQGLTVTIFLLITLQFLSQANASLSHSTLAVILVIIYILLFLIALGYLLIARGAGKLTAIEEVR